MLYKRDRSPFWWYAWTDAKGKRRRQSTERENKREATLAARELVAKADQEASRPLNGPEITLQAALDQYADALRANRQPSHVQAEHYARKAVGLLKRDAEGRFRLSGDMPLHSLEPIMLERLVMARRAEGNSPSTIAHEIKTIKAATHYAAGLRQHVPPMLTDRSIKNAWRMPEVPVKTRYLSWDEWLRLYDYMAPERLSHGPSEDRRRDARDILVALTLTGGRWGEVKSLSWDRVDVTGFESVTLWGNKTKEERIVPVPEQVRSMLRRRYADRTGHLIFPGEGGEERRSGSFRPITRAMNACGLNRADLVAAHGRATPHSLRHTFASWLLQNNADLAEVQDALGHKSLQMTRRYAHLSKRATADRLGHILSGVAGGHLPAPRTRRSEVLGGQHSGGSGGGGERLGLVASPERSCPLHHNVGILVRTNNVLIVRCLSRCPARLTRPARHPRPDHLSSVTEKHATAVDTLLAH